MYLTDTSKKEAIQERVNKMCSGDIYSVLSECDPLTYNETQGIYVSGEKKPVLFEVTGPPEDYIKLTYWSEGTLTDSSHSEEEGSGPSDNTTSSHMAGKSQDLTCKTLAWIYHLSARNLSDIKDQKGEEHKTQEKSMDDEGMHSILVDDDDL